MAVKNKQQLFIFCKQLMYNYLRLVFKFFVSLHNGKTNKELLIFN
jgi:hypothetical protein